MVDLHWFLSWFQLIDWPNLLSIHQIYSHHINIQLLYVISIKFANILHRAPFSSKLNEPVSLYLPLLSIPFLWDNPTSILLAISTKVASSIRQGWEVLYWIVIILYRCCNKLQPAPRNRWTPKTACCASVRIVKYKRLDSWTSVQDLYACTLHFTY